MVDDHQLVLEGFLRLLNHAFEVVATANNGGSLLALVPQHHPDVVFLDLTMPGLSGLAVVRMLAPRCTPTRFIALTMHTAVHCVRDAFSAGFHGYLSKGASQEELVEAVWTVLRGEPYVSSELDITADAVREGPGPAMREGSGMLTARQCEVVRLVAAGMSAKQIASNLGITTKTVEFHRGSIARQLGLKSTAAIIRYALAHGLVTTDDWTPQPPKAAGDLWRPAPSGTAPDASLLGKILDQQRQSA